MQTKQSYKLILRTKIFSIPSNSRFLNDISFDIYNELISNFQYTVKSNVRNKILRSFINYLIHREIPDINADNIDEYDNLSKEFDSMTNLVKLIKKDISKNGFFSPLISENQNLRKSIQIKNDLLNKKVTKFKQIIHLLFNNHGFDTYSDFYKFQDELIDACERQEVNLVDLLTRKKVEVNGFLFNINEKEKTAGLYRLLEIEKNIHIPTSIKYQSTEFLVTRISERAFKYYRDIESIQFSEDSQLQIIEEEAFMGCLELKFISIPSTVTHINSYAFKDCIILENIFISEDSKLRFIGEYALNNTKIKKLLIPSDLTEIKGGFCSIPNLETIQIMPENKNFIYYKNQFLLGKSSKLTDAYDVLIFARNNIKEVNIPSFIKVISANAFEQNKTIKKVCFSKDSELVLIERCAFFFSSLESITIPRHVNKISSSCFSNCDNLKEIKFIENSELKTIKKSSFSSTSISHISIPKGVIEIGDFCFSFCLKLKTVDFIEDSELKILNRKLFYNSSIENFTIPSNIIEIKVSWCFYSSNLNEIKIRSKNKNFKLYDNSFILGKSSNLNQDFDVLLFARRDIETAKIPPFIKFISAYAFDNCHHLKNIHFHEKSELKSIGKYAFSNSSIENISIPANITEIEKNTFSSCSQLKSVNFSKNSKLKYIKNHAFCDSAIESISIPSQVLEIEEESFRRCNNLQSVEFSKDSNLQLIGLSAFSNTSIESILIPNHVKCISGSFSHCLQLKKIEFTENSECTCIGKYALANTSLECFCIPSNVVEIKESWCCSTKKLLSIEIMPNNKNFVVYENTFLLSKSSHSLNDGFNVLLFSRRDIRKAIIPPFIRKISSYAFYDCSNLENVCFLKNSNLLIIGENAFCYTSLNHISLPSQVSYIGDYAFSDCSQLKKISFSKNSKLQSIGKYAFSYSQIESFSVHSKLIQIGDYAFSFCRKLHIIEIDDNANLISIKSNIFQGDANVIIMIPFQLKKMTI